MTSDAIERLSLLEQNLSSLITQKNTFRRQILEIENALSEIEGKDSAYHIVGTVMVKKDVKSLTKDLAEKKELFQVKVDTLEKQEASLRKQVEIMQQDVMKELKKGDSNE